MADRKQPALTAVVGHTVFARAGLPSQVCCQVVSEAGDRTYVEIHGGSQHPKFKLLLSPRLRDGFGNGEQFYSRAGTSIALRERRVDRPNREFLEWHFDAVFKAS